MVVILEKERINTGIVTFLDVLGWQGIYVRNSDAIKTLKNLIEKIKLEAGKQRGKAKIYSGTEIKSISDTIVMLTSCTEEDATAAMDIHGTLCQWILPLSIESGIPIRGAISFGEFQNEDNIFLGKAVDEAAAWHGQADWIGVHLTPSAEYLFDEELMKDIWIEYDLPTTKSQIKWKPHCVDWTVSWKDRDCEIKEIKAKFRQLGPISPEIAGKFVNTLKFINYVIKNQNMDE